MSRAVAFRHADWLTLVEPKGSFLTLPVLNRVFPSGLDRIDATKRREVRDRYPSNMADPAARTAWVEWVLGDLLRWGDRVRTGPQIPASLTVTVPEHGAVLRPDYALAEPDDKREKLRALVCMWPAGTNFDAKPTKEVAKDRWAATPAERAGHLAKATGVHLVLVTDGNQWRLVWSPPETGAAGATFLSGIFSEEPALLDAFTSLFTARRFFAVDPENTIESLLVESERAQEDVAQELGRQVRSAAELLVGAIGQANRERNGELLQGVAESEIYQGTVSVLMRLVFLLFAEERGLLPLDDEVYARGYAASTLREQLQAERDLFGEEPLERRSSGWFRLLALFRAVHGGLSHDRLRIPPYGGRLFDPDRFPFLEGREPGEQWKNDAAHPIPVDDLTLLEVLTKLQVLETREGGLWEARQLSYRLLEVEQIGHVYEGLLDHSVQRVHSVTLGIEGKNGSEPEVLLNDVEAAATKGRDELVAWLKAETGLTASKLTRLLDKKVEDHDRQLLLVAVENDEALSQRVLPYLHLLRRTPRDVPIVLLAGSIFVTQTSTRRDGGVEYTTRELAEEVARYTLEPLVYSPGPQDGVDPDEWQLRPSAELLDLRICDPAVGSGAILVAAGRFLADRLVEAWVAEEADEAIGGDDDVRLAARRAVADRCLYGVDRDPLATEMAKLSLWLTTMAKDRPFTFLDHAIRTGDALLGVTSLDQVRWMHLDPEKGRNLHTTLGDWLGVLEPLVDAALARRRRLVDIRVIDIRDAEDKARLTAEADADLELLRAVGDLVVGAHLSTATQRASAADSRLLVAAERVGQALAASEGDEHQAAIAALRLLASDWLNEMRPEAAPPRLCMHWPLEFPEVFLDREVVGFDAFVGNPPFIGGKKISGASGSDFREHLVVHVGGGVKGNADLVAFFFLRASRLGRSVGFLATNTVAQGDTSEVGLTQMIDSGWCIHRAVSSTRWPGQAALEIAKVWVQADRWEGRTWLDGTWVSGIDEMLYAESRSGWRKQALAANKRGAYIGSLVLGMGFTMGPEEAQALIVKDPSNAEVLYPYLGGEDINKSPTHTASRWIVNFQDWNEEDAKRYPDCFFLVDQRVKPERMTKDRSKYPKMVDQWWRYWNERVELYEAIRPLDRVIAISRVGKTAFPVFVATGQVFSESAVIFAHSEDGIFGVLSSSFHFRWVLRHASTLETRVRYAPSDVFETFPFPEANEAVADAGKKLNEHRAELMVKANEGLTATYNRVSNPDDTTPGIVKLRDLHEKLDVAVRDAYGWSDLDLQHGFHPVRGQGIRYTFSPEAANEVLERLLELNKERYEEEVAKGLHGENRPRTTRRRATTTDPAPSLFDAAADDTGEDR